MVQQTVTENDREKDHQQLLRCEAGEWRAKRGVKFIVNVFSEVEVFMHWIPQSRQS